MTAHIYHCMPSIQLCLIQSWFLKILVEHVNGYNVVGLLWGHAKAMGGPDSSVEGREHGSPSRRAELGLEG